ncbi:MAG TPA: hypothetical protein VH593_25755 [Ktedonobacteraceae bacterium]
MGVDAVVYCNCYRQGQIVAPPPDPHLVYVEDDGDVQLRESSEWDEQEERFQKWKETACQHPNMYYSVQRIANWGGYRLFQAALEQMGWERFPTLQKELPQANGGETSASAAKVALQELETFKQLYCSTEAVLVHVEADEEIMTFVPAWRGEFIFAPTHRIGFDPQGLFIRTSDDPPRECFRSMRLEQRPWHPECASAITDKIRESAGSGSFTPGKTKQQYIYTDLVTEQRYICPLAVIKTQEPCTLRVGVSEATAESYKYILEPLTCIFQAALETGNPVCWC